MLAMNQLINIAAKSRYMYGGQVQRADRRPLDDRQELGTGGAALAGIVLVFHARAGTEGGGADHALRRQGLFGSRHPRQRPGDVRGASHCCIFRQGPVPEDLYAVTPGKARVTASGGDVTLVGISYMQVECLRARDISNRSASKRR